MPTFAVEGPRFRTTVTVEPTPSPGLEAYVPPPVETPPVVPPLAVETSRRSIWAPSSESVALAPPVPAPSAAVSTHSSNPNKLLWIAGGLALFGLVLWVSNEDRR